MNESGAFHCDCGKDPDVWIIEDEAVSRRALGILLQISGYSAKTVASAEEALQLVSQTGQVPEVALVDLDLPGMNGLDLIDELEKANPDLKPVLITAASPDTPEVRQRKDVCYMRKPIDFGALLNVLSSRYSAGN